MRMWHRAALLAFIGTAAEAQVGVTLGTPYSNALLRDFQKGGVDTFRDKNLRRSEQPVEDRNLVRAGAWGRCVVRLIPDRATTYLHARSTAWQDPRSDHATFQKCRRLVGAFSYDHDPAILRAALADALSGRASPTAF